MKNSHSVVSRKKRSDYIHDLFLICMGKQFKVRLEITEKLQQLRILMGRYLQILLGSFNDHEIYFIYGMIVISFLV